MTEHTCLITNVSFSTGNTVVTADGFSLSPGNARTWATAVTAYRPDTLRAEFCHSGKTLTLKFQANFKGLDSFVIHIFSYYIIHTF